MKNTLIHGFQWGQTIAIPIYTVLPYCVIHLRLMSRAFYYWYMLSPPVFTTSIILAPSLISPAHCTLIVLALASHILSYACMKTNSHDVLEYCRVLWGIAIWVGIYLNCHCCAYVHVDVYVQQDRHIYMHIQVYTCTCTCIDKEQES